MDINTVLFFKYKSPEKKNFHPLLKTDPDINVFNVTVYDELEQILLQTKKFIIIVDSITALDDIMKVSPKLNAFTGKVILNLEHGSLKSYGFDVIKTHKDTEIVSNIELYFFGQVGLLGKKDKQVIPTSQSKNAFFTLIKYTGAIPKIIISSHLKDENISRIIGENFQGVINNYIIKDIALIDDLFTMTTKKNYYKYVYKVSQGLDRALCIIHLRKDDDFEEKVEKLKGFVSTLKIPKNTY